MFNLPLNGKPYYNCDGIANSIATDDMMDCYLEPVPEVGLVTRRRPGMTLFADLQTGAKGDGIFFWNNRQKVIAVSGGRVFDLQSNGTVIELSGASLAHTPVSFAEGLSHDSTPWLYMANAAGSLVYTDDGTTLNSSGPDGTHVSWINEKFIANVVNTNQFLFTDVDNNTGFFENNFWDGANNPVVCSAKGDRIKALFAAWQEVYAWGSIGCQIFQDDGVTPFVNIPGAYIEAGLEATYSVCKSDNTMFALCVIDGKRVVVKFQGRTPQVISEPIARTLSEMDTVDDAIGDIISVGGIAIYMLNFPTANQTWCYDFKNDTWLRWGHWNAYTATYDRFIGQHTVFVKPWNKHLIMSRVDGKIYELSRSIYKDDADSIVSYRRTGWIDHGNSWKRKRSDQFYIKVKFIPTGTGTNPNLLVRWRDNGNPTWSSYLQLPIELPLTSHYQQDFLIKLNRFGTYRARQYEFKLSDNVDLVLVGVTETVTELRN